MSYSYHWDGLGLLIVTPDDRSVYVQGEEGSQLHDELELIDDPDILQSALSDYDHVCD